MPWTVAMSLPEKVTLVRLKQLENAYSLMLVTLFGIIILVRLSQLVKASSYISVTPSEIVTLVNLVQW